MSEPLDANKSELTHKATATVAAWLDGLGCKPVETEVPCEGGWILDVASFWTPTLTEARQSKLLRALVPPSVQRDSWEAYNNLFRTHGARFTVGVEVKTSRADYLRDLGRKYGTRDKRATVHPVAHLMVLAAPGSVLGKDNLIGWATLRLAESCSSVVKFDGSWYANPLHHYQVEDLIAGVAIRRDHNTRYRSIRRWMKSFRAKGRPPMRGES